jgi:hypothetical protein
MGKEREEMVGTWLPTTWSDRKISIERSLTCTSIHLAPAMTNQCCIMHNNGAMCLPVLHGFYHDD